MAIGFIIGYLAVLLIVGFLAKRRAQPGHEDFFLASRRLGPLVLLVTLAATNFSSFTIFGFAGAGYRFGYAYYPIMAFGTGFMALTFILLGIPARKAAVAAGAITPAELIYHRFRNRPLYLVYLLVMVIFTLPYLALQPLGAGYMLNVLLGIPYQAGAALVVVTGLVYVLLAGLRGDAWTDLVQGLIMLVGIILIFLALVTTLGGFVRISTGLNQSLPVLFSRPGGADFFTPKIWFSYLVLWFLCDPMFPQLFQRFLAARDEQALNSAAVFYPLITGLLFFFPVAIGVLAHTVFLSLEGAKTDQVLPMMVNKLLSPFFAGVMSLCGIAALMSTMDSQLLTLSSMVIRDIRLLLKRPPETRGVIQVLVIALLALLGLLLALKPLGTILEIATETFTGLAVLFPTTIFAAYWGKTNPWACLGSIIIGELLVVLYHLKLLPGFGFLPVIPITVFTMLFVVIGSFIFPATGLKAWAEINSHRSGRLIIFLLVFILANDFWNWQRPSPLFLGLPLWLWYHFGLIAVLFVFNLFWIGKKNT